MSSEAGFTRFESRWMGLDVGTKTIGVAITDPMKLTARPLVTLDRRGLSHDCRAVLELAFAQSVEKLIVGRPLHLDGTPSEMLTIVEKFVEKLKGASTLSIEWADERLSTKEAEQLMADSGVDPRKHRARRNEFAAAVILTRYLEEKR